VMLLLGIQIVIISLVRFKKGSLLFSYDRFDEITIYAALPSVLLFGGLTMMKLHYANKLNSAALRKVSIYIFMTPRKKSKTFYLLCFVSLIT